MQTRTERKRRAEVPASENAIILVVVLLLLLFGIKRIENAAYLQNTAKANVELHRIFDLQQNFQQRTGRFTDDAKELGFEPHSYYGVVFLLAVDSTGFVARAVEAPGHDSFGDGQEGNEYLSIDQTEEIQRGVQGQ